MDFVKTNGLFLVGDVVPCLFRCDLLARIFVSVDSAFFAMIQGHEACVVGVEDLHIVRILLTKLILVKIFLFLVRVMTLEDFHVVG
jgi:hypothetical protein